MLELQKKHAYARKSLLIHHSAFHLAAWAIMNFVPGGHALFSGLVNFIGHMIIYACQLIFIVSISFLFYFYGPAKKGFGRLHQMINNIIIKK